MRRAVTLLLVLAALPAAAQSDLPRPEPTLLAAVECVRVEGPCEYRYAVINPGGAPAAATGFALLEAAEASVRSSAGWSVRQEDGVIRWDGGSGAVTPGWMVGGFHLSSPGLPRVALAEVQGGTVVRSVPTLVPGPAAEDLGDAVALLDGLLEQIPSLAGMDWIRPGPARGILAERLRTILDLLERDQRTAALQRIRSLTAEVQRLSPAARVMVGKTPGGGRPRLTSGAPLAPEVQDLFVAHLGLAMARLGALR